MNPKRRMSESIVGFFVVAMFLLLVFGLRAGCTDPVGATRTLEANGYSNIEITGYKWFAGGDDVFCTGFSANSANGTRVSGAVTRGWFFKGSTIRLD